MACDTRSTNIVLEAMDISWGRKQATCVTPVAPVGAADHFLISNTIADYYVWYDTTGTDVDPAVGGRTGIEVDVSGDNSVNGILTATKTAMEALDFWVTLSSDGLSMRIESKGVGAVTAAADVDTTFTIETEKSGIGGDLGKTEGGVELSMEVTTVDIVSDQTGESLLDKIITAVAASTSMSLLEMTVAKWKLLVGEGLGGAFTPAAGTEVVGYGDASVFKSFFDLGGELVMHPSRLAASDRTRDITIPLCVPNPESINFTSTETQKMEVTFEGLLDASKNSNINMFVFGDSSQDLRA